MGLDKDTTALLKDIALILGVILSVSAFSRLTYKVGLWFWKKIKYRKALKLKSEFYTFQGSVKGDGSSDLRTQWRIDIMNAGEDIITVKDLRVVFTDDSELVPNNPRRKGKPLFLDGPVGLEKHKSISGWFEFDPSIKNGIKEVYAIDTRGKKHPMDTNRVVKMYQDSVLKREHRIRKLQERMT